MHNHVCVCTYVYLYMCECVHLWCVCVCLCIYVNVCMYFCIYMCVCICICMYICICICIYMCVYVCIDIYTHAKMFIRFAVQYLLAFHSSLLYYNSICWCWTASRNVYFELTQEDFLSFSRTHLYICIFVYFCDTYLFLHWPLLFMWVFFIPVRHWFYSHHQGFSNWDTIIGHVHMYLVKTNWVKNWHFPSFAEEKETFLRWFSSSVN